MIYDLLIAGDFAGRGEGGRAAPEPLAHRRTWRVDRDDLEDVIARIAPEIRVSLDGGASSTTLRFASLDDFHPDQLAQQVPLLRQLRELRAEVAAPARVAPAPRDATPAVRHNDAAAAIAGGSLLDQILDGAPGAAVPAASRPTDELSEFVRRAVQPHTIRETTPVQRDSLAKIDDAIAAALRVLLHDPAFQSLEALWRGVDFATRRVDTSESLHVTLVDITRAELVSALANESDSAAGGMRTLLELPSADGERSRWSALVAAYAFGTSDVPLLDRLARLGHAARVPCLAAAEPDLGGAVSFGDGSDVDDWSASTSPEWDALRRSESARWLALALPRFLLRVPYGAKGEPCELVPFEEVEPERPSHDAFLWGNAALLCAVILAESAAAEEPWATQGTVERLPLYVTRVDGEPTAVPCAEALLSQRSVVHLVDRGLTALASARDGDAVRVPRLQSIAAPPAPLALEIGE